MIRAKTVSIVSDDAFSAGQECATELQEDLGSAPELMILFSASKYNHSQVLDGIYSVLPNVQLAGCSSYAEINSEEGLTHSVTAMGLKLDQIEFKIFQIEDVKEDSHSAGRDFGAEVLGFEPNLLIVFPDGLRCNGTQFLLGLQEVLGKKFPIVGGIAADMGEFVKTYQFANQRVLSGGVTGIALKGPIEIVTAAKSGWAPVGGTKVCNKVEQGNILLELDGKPALDVYKDYLQHRVSEMPLVSVEYPVGVVGGVAGTQKLPDDQILLIRAIKGIDEDRKAIFFGGDVPEGAIIRMTRATKDDVIRGATEAGHMVMENMKTPKLAFIFDCMARKVVLGARYKDELKDVFAKLGTELPKIGFYTYGELSPVQGVTMHHDETFTIALVRA